MMLEEILKYPKGEVTNWRSFVRGLHCSDGLFNQRSIAEAMRLCDQLTIGFVYSDGVYMEMARRHLEVIYDREGDKEYA